MGRFILMQTTAPCNGWVVKWPMYRIYLSNIMLHVKLRGSNATLGVDQGMIQGCWFSLGLQKTNNK
jgi:hypothetical protein